MPRYLAIDWDDTELRVAAANIHGDKVTIEDLVAAPLSDETQVNEALKRLIAENKLRASEAIICAHRSAVELRSLTVPPVPENELPDIVRFQALREFSELSEDWPIDYLPVRSTEEGITVKAAAMSPKRVAEATAQLDDCDLKPIGLILRPTALSALVATLQPKEGEIRLLVDILDRNAELTVVDGLNVHLMRTIHLPSGNAEQRDTMLVGEIARTTVAAKNQSHLNVATVVFFGSKESRRTQIELTQSKLNLKTECIDPLDSVSTSGKVALDSKDVGRFAAAIGMLCEQASEEHHTIDLLRPRKPIKPPSRRRLYTFVGLAVACCVVAAVSGVWYQLALLDSDIEMLRTTASRKKMEASKADARIENIERIQLWETSAVNWLDEFERMSTQMPEADYVQLTQMTGTINARGNGNVTLQGLASGPKVVDEIVADLTDDKHKVQTDNAQETGISERYPWSFKKTMTVVNATAEEAAEEKKVAGRPRLQPRNKDPLAP